MQIFGLKMGPGGRPATGPTQCFVFLVSSHDGNKKRVSSSPLREKDFNDIHTSDSKSDRPDRSFRYFDMKFCNSIHIQFCNSTIYLNKNVLF